MKKIERSRKEAMCNFLVYGSVVIIATIFACLVLRRYLSLWLALIIWSFTAAQVLSDRLFPDYCYKLELKLDGRLSFTKNDDIIIFNMVGLHLEEVYRSTMVLTDGKARITIRNTKETRDSLAELGVKVEKQKRSYRKGINVKRFLQKAKTVLTDTISKLRKQ